ncbi:uncharacterized protein LOC113522146 [Galleria mellonella]|uniref:Uncharacterized protein LOC113522146 n=1 Tax=Galleria mellonella TaxID=7137 RepID=A0A6J3C0H9_GALME|nr:uncharacterized protein LOC113522146 [Galleria mellonella]
MTSVDTEQILRQLLDKIAKELNYEEANVSVKAITTGGANYSSALYEVKISEPNKEERDLFAKVAIVGEVARSQFHLPLFDIERFAYNELLQSYAKIQDKNQLSDENRLVWPKFYGCNPNPYEETIVLENLATKGYVTYDRLKSIDWAYASKAVESLAKFHALSIAYGEENPTEYAKLLEKMKFNPNRVEHMNDAYVKLANMALAATREENKEKLKKYIEKEGDLMKMAKFYQPKGLTLLKHGDYRPSNLMHKTKEDGTLHVIPVDFQTISAGSPIIDLLYFIFTGSDEDFRRQHYEQLTGHYYQELSRALRNLNVNPEKIYPKEDYNKDLKEFLPFGLVLGLFTLPIITVEAENAPSLQGDDGINSMVVSKTSNLYPERLNGIVNDYIRWGIL